MLNDFGSKLSLGQRRVVRQVEQPRREEEGWDPISNNTAPTTKFSKKMNGGVSNVFQESAGSVEDPSTSAPYLKTGRKMISQPLKEQPIAPPSAQQPASPDAYGKTARMKYSRRYEANTNFIVGSGLEASSSGTVKTGRAGVQGVLASSGNILTGEGVPSEPVRRKQFIGGYGSSQAGERPWALHYENAPQ